MNRGMNSSDIKRANRGLFLKNIVLGTANSRIELAKLTGLTKMTAGMITLTNLLQPEAFILGYDTYYLPDKYIELMQQRVNNISFLKTFFIQNNKNKIILKF